MRQPGSHEPVGIRAAEATEAAQTAQSSPRLLRFIQRQFNRPSADAIHVPRACVGGGNKFQFPGALEYDAHLLSGADPRFVHVDDHPLMINHPP
ncbi:hypothetical protein [Paraburkholderia domus]|uniref:hypothetical protein n=1 Tax=Paraburkholderia domus TaxID=2793075 RepID=UPI0019132B39|nr:hypothetical protein [Paraburkholderia domus]MBK5166353.1 hypothetical protein [Burkholderia sp. R-70211]